MVDRVDTVMEVDDGLDSVDEIAEVADRIDKHKIIGFS